MNKKLKIFGMIIAWTIVFVVVYNTGLITTDINKISTILQGNSLEIKFLFLFLSTFRVVFFIPQTVFILLGSVLFGPYVGCVLSVIALVLSQSIMYLLGKYFDISSLGENYIEILKEYGYKILALGIVCPIIPSDLITATAGYMRLGYKKCLSIIVLVDSPMIFLYGFLGSGIEDAIIFKVLTLIIISFISYYSFLIWNKINKCQVKA